MNANLARVRSINDIGQVMGKKTTAEFAEDDEALAAVSQLGIDYAQGYGISKPMPYDAVQASLLLNTEATFLRTLRNPRRLSVSIGLIGSHSSSGHIFSISILNRI